MANDKKGVSPIATGVAGAIIGAAAAAAAIALSDEKNRKKAQETLENLEKEGSNILRQVKERALEIKDMVSNSASKGEEAKKLKGKK